MSRNGGGLNVRADFLMALINESNLTINYLYRVWPRVSGAPINRIPNNHVTRSADQSRHGAFLRIDFFARMAAMNRTLMDARGSSVRPSVHLPTLRSTPPPHYPSKYPATHPPIHLATHPDARGSSVHPPTLRFTPPSPLSIQPPSNPSTNPSSHPSRG